MQESYGEDLASHTDPESCAVVRKGAREALTGARAGGLLSREIRSCIPTLRIIGFCRKVRFLGQNPKIECREFNDIQTAKLSKKQLCDRTQKLAPLVFTVLHL